MYSLALLLLAVSIKQDGTRLLTSCSPDATAVTTLAQGDTVEIRFSLAGELGACYKVATPKGQSGYVPQSAVAGTEQLDRARAAAGDIGLPQMMRQEQAKVREQISTGRIPVTPALGEALAMLETNRARQALERVESALEAGQRSAGVLALAGFAAYQADQPRKAISYWRESLALEPNAGIAQLKERADRELAHDRSADRVAGTYFTLRYDGASVSGISASDLVNVLDEEYTRIRGVLGCQPREKIVAIVQTPDAYQASTAASEWSGGQFDGRIRIPVPDANQRISARTRRVFAHEIVHACIAQIGRFPVWFHEGLAQRLSGDYAGADGRRWVSAMLREGKLPPLEELSGGWATMSTAQATAAYQYALVAAEVLFEELGESRVRAVLAQPAQVTDLARDLSARLR